MTDVTSTIGLLRHAMNEHYKRTATELPAFVVTERQLHDIKREAVAAAGTLRVDNGPTGWRLFGIPIVMATPTVYERFDD